MWRSRRVSFRLGSRPLACKTLLIDVQSWKPRKLNILTGFYTGVAMAYESSCRAGTQVRDDEMRMLPCCHFQLGFRLTYQVHTTTLYQATLLEMDLECVLKSRLRTVTKRTTRSAVTTRLKLFASSHRNYDNTRYNWAPLNVDVKWLFGVEF
jgi:hypothetical protein